MLFFFLDVFHYVNWFLTLKTTLVVYFPWLFSMTPLVFFIASSSFSKQLNTRIQNVRSVSCVARWGRRRKPLIPLMDRWERIRAIRSYAYGTDFTSQINFYFYFYFYFYLFIFLIIHLIIILCCNFPNILIRTLLNLWRINCLTPLQFITFVTRSITIFMMQLVNINLK